MRVWCRDDGEPPARPAVPGAGVTRSRPGGCPVPGTTRRTEACAGENTLPTSSGAHVSVLRHLVSDPAVLRDCWEQAPFVATGLDDLGEIFSLDTVEQLILSGTLPLPCIRLFRDGAVVPVSGLGRPAERGASHRERQVDGAAVLAEIAAGATLVVEELQTYCPPLAGFTRSLTAETGCRTYCAAFLTPPRARGVAPHYDTASVFIRQFDGAKQWRVARPVHRWPVRDGSGIPAETEVVLEVELTAGQCLYVPRGFIHSGTATDASSAHLSVGLTPPTWASVLRRLTDTALAGEPLREALPYGFHQLEPAKLEALLAERLTLVTQRLERLASGPEAGQALAKAKPPPPAGVPAAGSLRSTLHELSGPADDTGQIRRV